jgi:hypothetical protein
MHGRDEECIQLSENLKERVHLGDLGIDGRIILNLILMKGGVRVLTEFFWLMTGLSGRLL